MNNNLNIRGTSDLDKNLLEIANSKGKIAAVKAYIEYTNSQVGLKDAKDYVDNLTKDIQIHKSSNNGKVLADIRETSDLDKDLIEIAISKGKIAAVKAYIEYTNSQVGLKDAKDYVDNLTKDIQIHKSSNNGKIVAIIIFIIAIATIVWCLDRL